MNMFVCFFFMDAGKEGSWLLSHRINFRLHSLCKSGFFCLNLTVLWLHFCLQSPTSLRPTTLVCSRTSFFVRMLWSMIVEKLSILVWQGFAKMTLGGDFCWKTRGQRSWRLDWIALALEKSLFTTMNCKALFIFLNKIWSTEFSLPMCEFVIAFFFFYISFLLMPHVSCTGDITSPYA